MNLFNLFAKIGLDDKDFNKGVDSASKKGSELEGNLTKMGKGIDKGVTLGLASAGAAITAFGLGGIKLASDLTEVQNVVDTTFESNAKTIDDWSKTAISAFGMSELNAKKFTGTLGAMMKSSGLTSEQITYMSTDMVGLAGDFASFYNLEHEEAFDKIRQGIGGETEGLKQLGINMSVANLEAFALTQGINKQWKEMDQAEQTQLRYQFLMNAGKDASGDFAKTLDTSLANQMKVAKEEFKAFSAEVGEKFLPMVLDAVKWIRENTDTLMDFAAAIGITALVLKGMFILDAIISSWKAYKLATEGATIAQWLLNGALFANPIVWIIGLIALLVGGIIYLWNTNEWFRDNVIAMFEAVSNAFKSFNDYLMGIFSKDWTESFGAFGNILNGFFANVSNIFESVKRIFGGFIDFVAGVFTGDWSRAWEGVVNIFGGIMDGLGAVIKAPLNTVIGLINMAIDGLNSISFTTPDWVPFVGGKHFGVDLPKINYLYEGGIVTEPTLLGGNTVVGDAYKGKGNQAEVVIPLDKLEQWIKDVASRPVTVDVDGRELARTLAPYQEETDIYNSRNPRFA